MYKTGHLDFVSMLKWNDLAITWKWRETNRIANREKEITDETHMRAYEIPNCPIALMDIVQKQSNRPLFTCSIGVHRWLARSIQTSLVIMKHSGVSCPCIKLSLKWERTNSIFVNYAIISIMSGFRRNRCKMLFVLKCAKLWKGSFKVTFFENSAFTVGY